MTNLSRLGNAPLVQRCWNCGACAPTAGPASLTRAPRGDTRSNKIPTCRESAQMASACTSTITNSSVTTIASMSITSSKEGVFGSGCMSPVAEKLIEGKEHEPQDKHTAGSHGRDPEAGRAAADKRHGRHGTQRQHQIAHDVQARDALARTTTSAVDPR